MIATAKGSLHPARSVRFVLNGGFVTSAESRLVLLTGTSCSIDSGRNRHGTTRLSHNETSDHIARGFKIAISDLPYTRPQWLEIACREGDLDRARGLVLTKEFAEDCGARFNINCFESQR